MSDKFCLPSILLKTLQVSKNHNCNPFHSFLSLSIRFSLLLFIPSLNVLSGDFYVSLNLVEVLTFGILSKCCDTAHLTFNLHFWFSKLWCSQLCKKEAFCATKVNSWHTFNVDVNELNVKTTKQLKACFHSTKELSFFLAKTLLYWNGNRY